MAENVYLLRKMVEHLSAGAQSLLQKQFEQITTIWNYAVIQPAKPLVLAGILKNRNGGQLRRVFETFAMPVHLHELATRHFLRILEEFGCELDC
jgi:hypothetical protein